MTVLIKNKKFVDKAMNDAWECQNTYKVGESKQWQKGGIPLKHLLSRGSDFPLSVYVMSIYVISDRVNSVINSSILILRFLSSFNYEV